MPDYAAWRRTTPEGRPGGLAIAALSQLILPAE
jgi:hypothetical protein